MPADLSTVPRLPLYPRFRDGWAPYRCRFAVGGRPQSWVQYHPTPEAARAGFEASVAREYPGRPVTGFTVEAV